MQKYLWGGAALLVVGAAGIYVASDYIVRHPDSVVARAGAGLSSAALNSNPLSAINRCITGTDTVREEESEVCGEEEGVAVAFPAKPGMPEQAEETIEPIQVEPEEPGFEPAQQGPQCDPDQDLDWLMINPIDALEPETPTPMTADEADLERAMESMVESMRWIEQAWELTMSCQSLGDCAELVEIMKQFNKLISQKKFKEAYAMAVRACAIDPKNQAAQAALSIARRAVTVPQDAEDLGPE
jgi:hypothetical protein